jgi:hypothetical protein
MLGQMTMAMGPPAWGSASTPGDAVLFPVDALGVWDVVELAGQPLPGFAEVMGPGLEHQFDIKKSPGANGATITDLGRDLAKFEIKLTMWTEQQWGKWAGLKSVLQPLQTNSLRLGAVDIKHPAVNSLGITSVYVTRVGMPHRGHVVGTFEVDLGCLEFRPASKAPATKTITPAYGLGKVAAAASSPSAAQATRASPPSATNAHP